MSHVLDPISCYASVINSFSFIFLLILKTNKSGQKLQTRKDIKSGTFCPKVNKNNIQIFEERDKRCKKKTKLQGEKKRTLRILTASNLGQLQGGSLHILVLASINIETTFLLEIEI